MTQTDEKELVLGNRQLMALFFVAAALCGVFFAIGYMIGRNSAKAALGGMAESPAASSAPLVRQQPEPPRETSTAQPDSNVPAVSDQPAAAEQTPIVETHPAQDSSAPPAPKAAQAPETIGVSVPESGASYLQVTALPRADADNMVRTLREQSFPVILAESSKDGLYRVLVGPFHQTTQLADAKNRLKTLGFANAFVQKQ